MAPRRLWSSETKWIRTGPEILATKSIFYPNTERVMGWDISEKGFHIVLSPEVPDTVVKHLGKDVDEFLAEQGVSRSDIKSWIMHTGRPEGSRGHRDSAGSDRKGAGGLLELPEKSRQYFFHLRAAGARGCLSPSPPGTWNSSAFSPRWVPDSAAELLLLRW